MASHVGRLMRSAKMGLAKLEQEIVTELHKLPPAGQQQVLAFVRALAAAPPKGVPGRDLLQFAGTIGPDDLLAMERAIETACERVNPDEW